MDNLSSFLGKFKKLLSSDAAVKEVVLNVCLKEKINLQNNSISLKDSTLIIGGSSLLKNQLFMKKQRLIEEINKELGKERITDIR